jgi:hypothetical protein
MLRTWIGKNSRLYIFGLVIQDHIESIGKPILLKGDEVLIMIYLLKCSMILLQNPQALPSSKYVQTLHSNSAPPKFPIRSHRAHLDLATARPSQIGSTDMDLGPTEMALPTLCYLLQLFRSHRELQSVPPRWLANSLLPYCFTLVPPR